MADMLLNRAPAIAASCTQENSNPNISVTPDPEAQSGKKRKRRATDEHFKLDYENLRIGALSKFIANKYSAARLTHKERCVLLWFLDGKFHRDNQKNFDSKAALKAVIEYGSEYFQAHLGL